MLRSMTRYVEVPREAFEAAMTKAGFKEEGVRGQLMFVRRHHRNPELKVKIYSSIPRNAGEARDCGEDSIVVVAVYEPPYPMKSRPLYRQRVFRVTSVEGVMERTLERAREAYVKCNEALKAIGVPKPKETKSQ
jgi:hypothetical protein